MSQVNPLPNYEDLGINKYMERSIAGSGQARSSEINFDQVQTTGSMGDKIQVGGENIIIDGANKRITISEGGVERVVIGKL